MTLDKFDRTIIDIYLMDYLENPEVFKLSEFIAHGNTSTLNHCKNVAEMAYLINKKYSLNLDLSVLLPGAFLHDLYFYD